MEGGEEGVDPDAPPSADNTEKREEWIAEWLEELCPYYMALGVSCEAFWYGDYTQLKYYVRAYDLKRQRKSEEMWMQGLYNFGAVSTAIGNALRKKGARPQKYIAEPFRMIPYTEKEKEAIAQQEERANMALFERMLVQWEKENAAQGCLTE